jgi:hypothetical protein
MGPTPEDRATQVLSHNKPVLQHLSTQEVEELKRAVALVIQEAVAAERLVLRDTLQLCKATCNEALSLPDVPHPFRAVVRVCKALCLEALGQSEENEEEGKTQEPVALKSPGTEAITS